MTANLIPFLYTAVFAAILVAVVPRQEIRRLAIYGILFGGLFDVVVVEAGNLLGEFRYINYEPFGLMDLHFMAPISWSIFYILYFYFLPDRNSYIYLYTLMGIFYSTLFCQMITKLGVLSLGHGIIDSIIPFAVWFPVATWGYLKLTRSAVVKRQNREGFFFSPQTQPAAKIMPEARLADYDDKTDSNSPKEI